MTDAEFLLAFEERTFPFSLWTHETHVRMAWLYLSRHDYLEAIAKIRRGIQRYAGANGKAHGYHETLTVAWARIVLSRLGPRTFEKFKAANAELFDRASDPILRHYRRETIDALEARAAFVEPDLAPLP